MQPPDLVYYINAASRTGDPSLTANPVQASRAYLELRLFRAQAGAEKGSLSTMQNLIEEINDTLDNGKVAYGQSFAIYALAEYAARFKDREASAFAERHSGDAEGTRPAGCKRLIEHALKQGFGSGQGGAYRDGLLAGEATNTDKESWQNC